MTSVTRLVFVWRPCTIHPKEGPNILGHYASTLRLALATDCKGRVLLSPCDLFLDFVAGSCVPAKRVGCSKRLMLTRTEVPGGHG